MLPLSPSPTYSVTAQRPSLPSLGEHLKLRPFTNRHAKTKKMAQMTEHFKPPEIIQLSSEQIANLSDAQFKTLVIRKLTELVELGRKLDEKMKAVLRETKAMYREPIVRRRKLGIKSMVWTRRKKETSNQKKMKKQELGEMRRGLGTSRTS